MTGDWAGADGAPALAGGALAPSAAPAPTAAAALTSAAAVPQSAAAALTSAAAVPQSAAPPATSAAPAPTSVAVPPSAATLINRCDALLGEIGRRMHRFAWLRPPGTAIDACMVVDVYYPGNRIVVLCGGQSREEEMLCRELVPAHGLRLLLLSPEQFSEDTAEIDERLVAQLGSLAAALPRPRESVRAPQPTRTRSVPPPSEPPITPLGAARSAASRARAGDGTPAGQRIADDQRERAGMVLGMTMLLLCAAELIILVAIVGIGGGHLVLAIGFAFDVCARAMGTIAFTRESDEERAWTCLIFGSPAVVNYTVLSDATSVTEPAPLGGALGMMAIGLVGLALAGALLGI